MAPPIPLLQKRRDRIGCGERESQEQRNVWWMRAEKHAPQACPHMSQVETPFVGHVCLSSVPVNYMLCWDDDDVVVFLDLEIPRTEDSQVLSRTSSLREDRSIDIGANGCQVWGNITSAHANASKISPSQ